MANSVKKNKVSTKRGTAAKNRKLSPKESRRRHSTRTLVKIAILGALAAVVMMWKFRTWFAPGFYTLDFSEVIVLIGAFSMGPVCGVAIEAIKILVNLMIDGTMTGGVGELANFIMGCSFIVPAALIYKNHKSFKTAIAGLMTGTVCVATVSVFVNWWIMLPAYAAVQGKTLDYYVGLGTELNSNITNPFTFFLLATAPFNFLKALMSSVVTMLLYKRVSPILRK